MDGPVRLFTAVRCRLPGRKTYGTERLLAMRRYLWQPVRTSARSVQQPGDKVSTLHREGFPLTAGQLLC